MVDTTGLAVDSFSPLTRSRSSSPALKCGTHFSGTGTFSPGFGFLPTRGGLQWIMKLPNPRISISRLLTKREVIASNIALDKQNGICGRLRKKPLPTVEPFRCATQKSASEKEG